MHGTCYAYIIHNIQFISKIPHPHGSFQLEKQDLNRLVSGECLNSKVSSIIFYEHLINYYTCIQQVVSACMTLLQTAATKVSNLLPYLIQ